MDEAPGAGLWMIVAFNILLLGGCTARECGIGWTMAPCIVASVVGAPLHLIGLRCTQHDGGLATVPNWLVACALVALSGLGVGLFGRARLARGVANVVGALAWGLCSLLVAAAPI